MLVDCLLHVHSSFSYDSKTDLSEIARIARSHRIGCVLMSEHNNFMNVELMSAFVARCRELSDEQLLIVPGLELAFDSNRVHLLAFGVQQYIESASPATTFRALVDSVHASGGVAVLAHPSHRAAATRLQSEDLRELDGIEIWNVKNGNKFFPTVEDLDLLRHVRATAPRPMFGFAGLDWHHVTKFSPLVLRVDTPELTADSILFSLKAGTFTIRGGLITIPATGQISRSVALAYKLGSKSLKELRRAGYRWQSKLERSGFKTPRAIAAVARRFF